MAVKDKKNQEKRSKETKDHIKDICMAESRTQDTGEQNWNFVR